MIRSTRRRKPAVNGLVLLTAVGLTLVGTEIIVRQVAPQYYLTTVPGVMLEVGDPLTRLRPGFQGRLTRIGDYDTSISISSLGLRGPEISAKKGPEVYRILLLGDSFTFGFGVEYEDTFSFALAELLNEDGEHVETLNAGIPGTGINNSLWWLEKYGVLLDPDLVLLGVCLANDLSDADLLVHEFPVKWETPHWLYRKSHLFRMLARAVSPAAKAHLGLTDSFWGTQDQVAGQIYLREMFARYAEGQVATSVAMEKNRDALDQLAALSERHGFQLSAFLIPSPYHLFDEPWEAILETLDMSPDEYRRDLPLDFFRNELMSRNIPTLDLSAVTAERLSNGDRFFLNDGHWTPFGHRVVAEELRQFLREEDLLK